MLIVEVDGRTLRLEEMRTYRIGRAIEADVVLAAGSVSRQHAELRPVRGGWLLADAGSQFGTFADGRRVSELPLTGRTVVRCGPAAPGAELVVTVGESAEAQAAAPAFAPAPPPPAAPVPPAGPGGPGVPGASGARPAPGAGPGAVPRAGAPGTPAAGTPGAWAPPPAGARPAPAAGAPVPAVENTEVLAATTGFHGPGAARSGPDLLLVAEGREHRFRHPARITVGRQTDSTVVLTDPACSRQHATVDAVPGGWVFTNHSGEGSFAEGRRVASQRFDDRLVLRLGHPVAGPELTLVPILSAAEEEKRMARRRLRRRLLVAGVAAAVLVLVAGIGIGSALLLSGGDDDTTTGRDGSTTASTGSPGELTGPELEAAKAATVKISAESYFLDDPSQTPLQYGGSGSILRSDGLILTNAHVAAPESPGLMEKYGESGAIANPEYVLISLTDGATDTSNPAEYRARVVEADGYLDVAILEIYADVDGQELDEEPDLPTVPVGSSAELRAGDDVTVLGFPAVAGAGDSITVTTGVISTVLNDPELGPRSELDTDARIAPGNSGGMAVDDEGMLIGIPTSLQLDQQAPVASGRIRSIDAVKDLIETAEAETS